MNVVLRLARQFGTLAGYVPVVVRLIVGFLMFAHGIEKLSRGVAGFGESLSATGLPAGLLLVPESHTGGTVLPRLAD